MWQIWTLDTYIRDSKYVVNELNRWNWLDFVPLRSESAIFSFERENVETFFLSALHDTHTQLIVMLIRKCRARSSFDFVILWRFTLRIHKSKQQLANKSSYHTLTGVFAVALGVSLWIAEFSGINDKTRVGDGINSCQHMHRCIATSKINKFYR